MLLKQFAQFLFIENRDAEGAGLLELRAGVISRHDIVRPLRYRPGNPVTACFDQRLCLVARKVGHGSGQDEGLRFCGGPGRLRGKILPAYAGRPRLACTVVNLSEHGALIELSQPTQLPPRFAVTIEALGFTTMCEPRHQDDRFVGDGYGIPTDESRDALELAARTEAILVLLRLVAPMAPHLAEEAWARLGQAGLVVDAPWPVADPALLVDDSVTIAVQVNGKLKDSFDAAKGADKAAIEAEALMREKVVRALGGAPIKKVIVVPDRLVNLVI